MITAGPKYMEERYGGHHTYYVYGKKAIVNLANRVQLYPRAKSVSPYRKEIDDFINAVINGKEPRATGLDGLVVTQIIEKIVNMNQI